MTVAGVLAAAPTAWQWVADHRAKILHQFVQHVELTVIAVVLGLVISIPLALYAYRHPRAYGPITSVTGLMYTIPSLALFVILLPLTGISFTTVEIALVSYTLLILIRNIVRGIRGVPAEVLEAANGMGYTPRERLWRVEVPLALAVIIAGVRVATISTIGLVTVTALIGQGGFGFLILIGIQRFFSTELIVGAVCSVALAIAADALLVLLQRRLTPWTRAA